MFLFFFHSRVWPQPKLPSAQPVYRRLPLCPGEILPRLLQGIFLRASAGAVHGPCAQREAPSLSPLTTAENSSQTPRRPQLVTATGNLRPEDHGQRKRPGCVGRTGTGTVVSLYKNTPATK